MSPGGSYVGFNSDLVLFFEVNISEFQVGPGYRFFRTNIQIVEPS
jgi:hypothetical protein